MKWFAAFAVVVGALVYLFWDTSRPVARAEAPILVAAKPEAVPESWDRLPAEPVAAEAPAEGDRPAAPAGEEPYSVYGKPGRTADGKLDPKGEEFALHVEEEMPMKIYYEAAQCYEGGLNKDLKIKLGYTIRVVGGEAYVLDVRVMKSNLNKPKLENCIVEAAKKLRWREPDMPDYTYEDELVIRIGGMKKYLEKDPDADPDDEGAKQGYPVPR